MSVEIVEFQNIRVKMTNMMEQYLAAKQEQPDSVLFFRMGDFYELFFNDAILVNKLLGIKLTARNKKGAANSDFDPVPMAGVPVRSVEDYIAKLVQQGHRVVICDQLESPGKANIVRRGITRIVTPGTIPDSDNGTRESEREHRYLAAISALPRRAGALFEEMGLALIDINTGAFSVTEVSGLHDLDAELARLEVREVIVSEKHQVHFKDLKIKLPNVHIQVVDEHFFKPRKVLQELAAGPSDIGNKETHATFLSPKRVEDLFKGVKGYGFKRPDGPVNAVAAIVRYVSQVQRGVAGHVKSIRPYRIEDFMILDEATQANLELTETLRGARREGSLLGIIDQTVTSAGARRLRQWLSYPLLNRAKIELRLEAVDELLSFYAARQQLRECLDQVYDIERLCGRLATGRANPRDLIMLSRTLELIPELQSILPTPHSAMLRSQLGNLDPCQELKELITTAIVDDPPNTFSEGGVIRPGYDAALDEVSALARSGKDWLLSFEQNEKERTTISSLKIKYSKVFGYFIEVSKANLHKVPAEYLRRQTLSNCERYYTPELKEYEEKVLTAQDRRLVIEQRLFDEIRLQSTEFIARLRQSASKLATLDVLATLAEVAHEHDYCRPKISDDDRLIIRKGRHPVVERYLDGAPFVPNDIVLNGTNARLQLITGPNMAGKSTVIRQVALISLLAQSGSFVPAESAEIGIVDRIFSRVGASDNLTRGQSTFMVEMTETAHILKHSTAKSLVILDEIGRGTATFDGLSIAWAVVEFLHDKIKARTLFATHYHELTELSEHREGVVNYSIAVKEQNQNIIFLRTLIQGAANRSYGIQVGRLAGLPEQVVNRATEVLEHLERHGHNAQEGLLTEKDPSKKNNPSHVAAPEPGQLALFMGKKISPSPIPPPTPSLSPAETKLLEAIASQQLETTSPIQALNLLFKWQRVLKRR